MEIHLLAKKHTIGQWPPGLLMGPNPHPKRARAWRVGLIPESQREYMHRITMPEKRYSPTKSLETDLPIHHDRGHA